jgi:mRNA interferase MazF
VSESPLRGQVWTVDLDPARGHQQARRRPSLVVSADAYNEGPAGMVVVAPITSARKRSAFHVGLEPPEGGLRRSSFVKPEDVRAVSTTRLGRRLGAVSPETMAAVETSLRVLLQL